MPSPDIPQATLPPSGLRVPILNHRIATREAFEALSQSAHLPMEFRTISRETPRLDLQGFRTPNVSIWTIASPTGFESVPVCEVDVFSIRIPLHGGLLRKTGTRDHAMVPGEATMLTASEIVVTRCEPGSKILGCTITTKALRERYRLFEDTGDAPLLLSPRADTSRLPTRALIHTLQQLATAATRDPEGLMSPLLEDLLMNQVLTAWPMGKGGDGILVTGPNQLRAFRCAVDYIEAHLSEPLTVSLVAAASGVSVRTLQSVFQAQTGRTPLGHILNRRLERAHADLLANDARLHVSQIAYRWGFVHMGEFARRYRLRYGCLPSQTGRRAS